MSKMKRLYILMMLLLTGIMAEAQTSVWDGSRKLWTHGEGTENNPYLIESAENLAFLSYMVGKDFKTHGLYFRLTTDIDLNGSEDQPWIPIGLFVRGYDEDGCDRGNLNDIGYTPQTAFSGHFDGGNHVISNLYVDNPSGYAGLFGYVDGYITGEEAVIENVFVSGGYIKGSCAGGIVGKGKTLVVSHCRNVADVEGNNVGGIVGMGNPKVINCSNAGSLTGIDVGGIVGGRTSNSEITECYNEGTIKASGIGGGILGGTQKATIVNCYNVGEVAAVGDTSTYFPTAGGLVGIASPHLTVRNSYNVGEITGNHHVGCLIGYAPIPENLVFENCYYLDNCFGSEFGISKSAEEMRDEAFVATLNQDDLVWSFDENHVNDGFPVLTRTDLSVDDFDEGSLKLYPNPTHDVVRIEGVEAAVVQVYNALGQLVKTIRNSNEIDLQGLPKGVYALHILGSDGICAAYKVVKE